VSSPVGCEKVNPVRDAFLKAFSMLKDPSRTLEEIRTEKAQYAFVFLLLVGAVTAFLSPLQVYLGFEDINGLHAGGQAEFLAKDVSSMYALGIEWRPFLIETFYVFILLFTTAYLHVILKILGGKGTVKDTLMMIAYGDAPGLLFGWIPYFATIAAMWAAVIQLFIGPIVLHKISWTRASVLFSALMGLGIIEIALA
jgi:hypothetical protein